MFCCKYLSGHDQANESASSYFPIKISYFPFRTSIEMVSCGFKHTAILSRDGQVFTWGLNASHQLGLGSSFNEQHSFVSYPQQVNFRSQELIRITYVSLGRDHSVCIDSAGKAYSWGWGEANRLGLGDVGIVSSPRRIPSIRRTKFCSCGREQTVLVTDLGGLITFGAQSPDLDGPIIHEHVVSASCGDLHVIVATKFGNVFVFGNNETGALGLGVDVQHTTYFEKLEFRESCRAEVCNVKMVKVAAGGYHSVCLDELGAVWAFGQDIGHTPRRFFAGGQDIAAGFCTVAVVCSRGKIYYWGDPNQQDLEYDEAAASYARTTVESTSPSPSGETIKYRKVLLGGYGVIGLC